MTIRLMPRGDGNGLPAMPGYVWRDPKRVSPAQLRELENEFDIPEITRAAHLRSARRERMERYSFMREHGSTVWEASQDVGVGRVAARNYEREYQRHREAAEAHARLDAVQEAGHGHAESED
jgi:hypothetical protein